MFLRFNGNPTVTENVYRTSRDLLTSAISVFLVAFSYGQFLASAYGGSENAGDWCAGLGSRVKRQLNDSVAGGSAIKGTRQFRLSAASTAAIT